MFLQKSSLLQRASVFSCNIYIEHLNSKIDVKRDLLLRSPLLTSYGNFDALLQGFIQGYCSSAALMDEPPLCCSKASKLPYDVNRDLLNRSPLLTSYSNFDALLQGFIQGYCSSAALMDEPPLCCSKASKLPV
ncbi:hypothetical protein AVEN_190866-1 [Araneus ventricosus]|uniref:Uncharacterized protein n=1 Tax=Araneus ventricosus TaxID=182803 RepID=A0A4Y2CRU5_ARAVE|nr:hypothetical protein AVEN_190866-1 [Araneus ventricosus]